MAEFPMATGSLSARIHGAAAEMRERAEAALVESKRLDKDSHLAAALRGKARGYREAADLLDALERGRRLPKRNLWTRPFRKADQ